MGYEELLAKGDEKKTRHVINIADVWSLIGRGSPVRDFSQIQKGELPAPDEMSVSAERYVEGALALYASGIRETTLDGLSSDKVLEKIGTRMSREALEVARDVILIEKEYAIMRGV